MRHAIHKLICWYLRRCAGAFHCYNYGETGRYVVLMNEGQYADYQREQSALQDILSSHGMYGDGGNLDKFTRRKCLEALKATEIDLNANTTPSLVSVDTDPSPQAPAIHS